MGTDLNVLAIAVYLGTKRIEGDAVSGTVHGWVVGGLVPVPQNDASFTAPGLKSTIRSARRAAKALVNPTAPSVTEDVDDRPRS